METYNQRGADAFDEAALILFMAVGSIIARTRGPEGLHDAMEALRLASRWMASTGPAYLRRSTRAPKHRVCQGIPVLQFPFL